MTEHTSKNGLIIFWLITIALVAAASMIVSPFLPAILWATVFSILLYPQFLKMVEKGWNRTLAALTVTLMPAFILILPVVVMGSIAGVQVVSYANELFQQTKTGGSSALLQRVASEIDTAIQPILLQVGVANVNLVDVITKNSDKITENISGPLTNGLKSFVITIVTLVISLLTMFFMVRDGHNMKGVLEEIVPLPKDVVEGILQRVAITVRSVFIGVVMVSIIQGTLAGIAYWICGVPGALVWMLVTTVLCMIPLLGSPIAYVPISLSLILQGKTAEGVGLLLFGFLVISQIDNILRPFFIGASAKLHPMPIFFSLLGGVLVLGPVGLMAGPMILTLLLAVADILRAKKKLDDEQAELTPDPA